MNHKPAKGSQNTGASSRPEPEDGDHGVQYYAQEVYDKAHEVYDKAQGKVHKVYDRAQEVYDRAHDKAQAYYADVQSYAEQMKGTTGIRRVINALGYSWDGVKSACDEAGFRQLLWINGVLLLLVLLLPFGLATQLVLILASCMSLVVELLNTGLEAAVDHTSQDKHELAKRAKDVGSAAQYLTLMMLIALWLLALWRTFMAA